MLKTLLGCVQRLLLFLAPPIPLPSLHLIAPWPQLALVSRYQLSSLSLFMIYLLLAPLSLFMFYPQLTPLSLLMTRSLLGIQSKLASLPLPAPLSLSMTRFQLAPRSLSATRF